MKSITVFCGSNGGTDPIYREVAYKLGTTLALRGIRVIYGGASIGMMGAVADGALESGGQVVGVIPDFLLKKEIAHQAITELMLVKTMHDRKSRMNELCDGIIALPGGLGTLEELFEMLTWAQLGLHHKPIGILNIDQYFDPLLEFLDRMTTRGFLKDAHRQMLLVSNDITHLLHLMVQYRAPSVGKWIKPETT